MKLAKRIAISLAALSLVGTAGSALAQSAEWTKQVARIIASKQTYPRTAQMRGEEGSARVKVYIGANGAIERTELIAPSGSATLDKEALAMPTRAGSVPPPPGGAATVIIPVTWKLL